MHLLGNLITNRFDWSVQCRGALHLYISGESLQVRNVTVLRTCLKGTLT